MNRLDFAAPSRLRVATIALMTSAAVLMTSCQSDLGPGSPGGSSAVESGPVDYANQEVLWGECDADTLVESPSRLIVSGQFSVVCGEVIVPASYDQQDLGVDFRIQMMKLTSESSAEDKDAIFINPGGPGGSGVEQVQTSNFPDELVEAFDIIGFDPRGVGSSIFTDGTTIKCSDELDYLSYFSDSAPASLEEYQALIAESDKYYLDCTDTNPLWWTLSTAAVVNDLDIMRQAVTGERPLNFIGSSYGTTIAGRYVTEFPERVGKIVLDSPTTVNEDRIESALQSLEADEAKLRGFLTGHAGANGQSVDESWAQLLQVRDWAREGELAGFAGPEPSAIIPGAQVSSEALLRRGILTMNYLPEDVAQGYFSQGLDQAFGEKWNGLFEWFGFYIDGYDPDSLAGRTLQDKSITRSNEFEVRVIVNSMDYAPPELTEDEQRELSTRAKEVAPLLSELSRNRNGYEYVGPRLGVNFQTLATDDPTIPTPPNTPFIPQNTSGIPLLVVGSISESVTPYTFAQETADLLGSPLISVESSRHAPAAYYTSACVNEILVAFFTTDLPITSATCPE